MTFVILYIIFLYGGLLLFAPQLFLPVLITPPYP